MWGGKKVEVKVGLSGWIGSNLWIEMVCLPSFVLHPLDSERPFFSTATKGEGRIAPAHS